MHAVEIFAGIGGLALGFARHKVVHELLCDFDTKVHDTLTRNQGLYNLKDKSSIVLADVRDIDLFAFHGIDFVTGGPPCQPFSGAGKALGRADPRDMLQEAVRTIRIVRPKIFVFENVRGLTREAFADYFEQFRLSLACPSIVQRRSESSGEYLVRLRESVTEAIEYQVSFKILDAADYGVPQRRERVFVVGLKRELGIEWSFPKATHSGLRLLADKSFTGDYWRSHEISPVKSLLLRTDMRRLEEVSSLVGLKRWNTVRDVISALPVPGRTSRERREFIDHVLRPGARAYKGHNGSALDLPAKTLKAGTHGVPGGENMIALPNGNVRYFTVRECARLQTFPDEFRFPDEWSNSTRQLGNAVPVDLAAAIAKSLIEALRRAKRDNAFKIERDRQ